LNSPISPTIPVIKQETKVINTEEEIKVTTPSNANTKNIVVESNNIVDSTTVSNQINPQSISLEKMSYINMDISLSQLMKYHLVNVGDKIVFVQNTIFTGEILEHGKIKLEWCNQIVPNIAAFTERCGIKYSIDCLDSIYCKGETIKKLIISFHEQLPHANTITTIETVDFSNFEANYINLDFTSDNIYDDQLYYDYNALNDYMDISKDGFLNNVFEDYDYNSYIPHGDTILTQEYISSVFV